MCNPNCITDGSKGWVCQFALTNFQKLGTPHFDFDFYNVTQTAFRKDTIVLQTWIARVDTDMYSLSHRAPTQAVMHPHAGTQVHRHASVYARTQLSIAQIETEMEHCSFSNYFFCMLSACSFETHFPNALAVPWCEALAKAAREVAVLQMFPLKFL